MGKKQEPKPRTCTQPCACDKCFKPKPEDEKKAAEWWRELYKRMGWPKDNQWPF